MRSGQHTLALLPALLMVAVAGLAQPASIVVRTRAEKREFYVDGSGTERARMVAVDVPTPGEEMYYTIGFTNLGDEPVEAVTVTQPVPPGMVYIPGTAVGPGTEVTFSIDGGESYADAGELRMDEEAGGSKLAPPERYTHIRWVMRHRLEPGATALARFRVRPDPEAPPTSPGPAP